MKDIILQKGAWHSSQLLSVSYYGHIGFSDWWPSGYIVTFQANIVSLCVWVCVRQRKRQADKLCTLGKVSLFYTCLGAYFLFVIFLWKVKK